MDPRPAPTAAEFPTPNGRTLTELRRGLGPGPVLAPSVSLLEPGQNRFAFGLFDRGRRQLADAPAAVYVERRGSGEVAGPFPARYESLDVAPEFRSQSSSGDPDSATAVYAAQASFKRPGRYSVLGVVRLDGRLAAAEPVNVEVVRDGPVPDVGDPAPKIQTPTTGQGGGDVSEIETRVPPGTMHEQNFADVVGRRPVALLFATPALCRSRVCGPVADVTEEVKARYDGDAAFVHMEIYENNRVEDGFRPQVAAYKLPTEPWLFTVDRRGRIAARIEGAFGARELEEALAKAE